MYLFVQYTPSGALFMPLINPVCCASATALSQPFWDCMPSLANGMNCRLCCKTFLLSFGKCFCSSRQRLVRVVAHEVQGLGDRRRDGHGDLRVLLGVGGGGRQNIVSDVVELRDISTVDQILGVPLLHNLDGIRRGLECDVNDAPLHGDGDGGHASRSVRAGSQLAWEARPSLARARKTIVRSCRLRRRSSR